MNDNNGIIEKVNELKIHNTPKVIIEENEIKRRTFRVSMLTELEDFYKWIHAFKTTIPELDIPEYLSQSFKLNAGLINEDDIIINEMDDQVMKWFIESTISKEFKEFINKDDNNSIILVKRICEKLKVRTSDESIKDFVNNEIKLNNKDNITKFIQNLEILRYSLMITNSQINQEKICDDIINNNKLLSGIKDLWSIKEGYNKKVVEFIKLVKKVDLDAVNEGFIENEESEDEELENPTSFCACSDHMGGSIGHDHSHSDEHEHHHEHHHEHRHSH